MQNAWHSLLHFPIDRVLKIRWWPFEGFLTPLVSSVMCINFKVETFVQKEKLNPCGMGASTLSLSLTSEDDARINYQESVDLSFKINITTLNEVRHFLTWFLPIV